MTPDEVLCQDGLSEYDLAHLTGHPYAGDNLAYDRGSRVCLTCRRAWHREAYRRRQEAAA